MVVVVFFAAVCSRGGGYEPRNGDILFQISRSSQSAAIQLATRSRYSHMGIVYIRESSWAHLQTIADSISRIRLFRRSSKNDMENASR
jgi:hypothetical protein